MVYHKQVLQTGSTLPLERQVDVIYACCALLNLMTLQGEGIDDDANPLQSGILPVPGALEQAARPSRIDSGVNEDGDVARNRRGRVDAAEARRNCRCVVGSVPKISEQQQGIALDIPLDGATGLEPLSARVSIMMYAL